MDLIYLLIGFEVLVVLIVGFYLIKKFRNTVKERKNRKKGDYDPKKSYRSKN